jgi:hypothetical protein
MAGQHLSGIVCLATVHPLGLTLAAVIGMAAVLYGAAILSDWHGWGRRFFEWTSNSRLPGAGFYRDWGFGTFRVLVGGGAVLVGTVFVGAVVFGMATG